MTTTTTNKTPTAEVRKELDAMVLELEKMRDEVRVKLHLAGMDLKTAWDKLDPEYLRLRDGVRDAKDDTVHAMRDAMAEIRKGFSTLRAKIDAAQAKH